MHHKMHDEISLEMGRRVAARLRERPDLIQVARLNLARWLRGNAQAPSLVRCYQEWQAALDRPIDDVCRILEKVSEENQRLRQNSPFAGILPPDEVWSIKTEIRQRHVKSPA